MSTDQFLSKLKAALDAREHGEPAAIASVVRNSSDLDLDLGARMLIRGSEQRLGSICAGVDAQIAADAMAQAAQKRSLLVSYRANETSLIRVRPGEGVLDIFYDVYLPDPQLVIAGAGHIAVPLARIAALLEYRVVVIDDREEYASRARFPEAHSVIAGPFRESLRQLRIDANSYVVLVTRGHVHDQECLEEAIKTSAPYIGMIGSKRRVRTALQRMRERGATAEELQKVFAPIGLDVSAETPGEIAVAIMAEVINVRRSGDATSLSAKRSPA